MDKVEIRGFEYIGTELSFIVNKDLWRESDVDSMPIRWISTIPTYYVSTMEKGTVFLFSGMTEKIKKDLTNKWEKGEPIYIMDKKLDIPGKEERVFEEIKCDINRIGEIKDTIEEMKMLKNTKELVECK